MQRTDLGSTSEPRNPQPPARSYIPAILGAAKFGGSCLVWAVLMLVLPVLVWLAAVFAKLPQSVEFLGLFIMPICMLVVLGLLLWRRQYAASAGVVAAYLANILLAVVINYSGTWLGYLEDGTTRNLVLSGWSVWLALLLYAVSRLH